MFCLWTCCHGGLQILFLLTFNQLFCGHYKVLPFFSVVIVINSGSFSYNLPIQIWIPDNIRLNLDRNILHPVSEACGDYQMAHATVFANFM